MATEHLGMRSAPAVLSNTSPVTICHSTGGVAQQLAPQVLVKALAAVIRRPVHLRGELCIEDRRMPENRANHATAYEYT